MNEASKNYNLVFAMMFNQRTNPIYRKIHELVNSKAIWRNETC